MFLNISTFLPFHLKQTCYTVGLKQRCMDETINSMTLSVILAMYNVARLLLSTTVGATMNKVGRKNYILIGFAFMILSTIGFGLLDFLPNNQVWVFFGGAVFFRFLQGIGGTCLQVAGQTIILSEFANNREKGLSYFNASRGLGIFLGPISGGVIYTSLGPEIRYLMTFVIFSVLLSIAMILSFFLLPGRLNENNAAKPAVKRATARLSKMQQNVSYIDILKNKRALFCLITVIFA